MTRKPRHLKGACAARAQTLTASWGDGARLRHRHLPIPLPAIHQQLVAVAAAAVVVVVVVAVELDAVRGETVGVLGAVAVRAGMVTVVTVSMVDLFQSAAIGSSPQQSAAVRSMQCGVPWGVQCVWCSDAGSNFKLTCPPIPTPISPPMPPPAIGGASDRTPGRTVGTCDVRDVGDVKGVKDVLDVLGVRDVRDEMGGVSILGVVE